MDEMEFPSVARAIVESGKPIYYRGELTPNNIGLWHPPLYIAWYAAWFKISGFSIESGRIFGLFNSCLTLIVISVFVWYRQRDLGNESGPVLRVFALLIALLVAATSPIFVQGSILPDIDTQILPLAVTAVLLLIFEMRGKNVSKFLYWLVFVFGVVFLTYAKLTMVMPMFLVFTVYEIVESLREKSVFSIKVKRAEGEGVLFIVTMSSVWRTVFLHLLYVTGAFIVALTVFLVSWFVIARFWGVDYQSPFVYLGQSTNNPLNFSGSNGVLSVLSVVFADIRPHFGYAVQWIGLPALSLVFVLIVREFRFTSQGILRRSERVALLTFFLALLFMYLILRPAPFAFPKYWPPLIPVLAVLTADLLLSLKGKRHPWLAFGLIVVGVMIYQAYAWINPITTGRDFILAIYTEWPKEPLIHAWQTVPLVTVLVLAGIVAFFTRQSLRTAFAVASVTVTLGWQVNVISQQIQAPYSTTYMYGEQSIQDVVDHLRKTLPDGVIVIAPKDVGYILQDRWRYIELYADPRPYLDMPGVHALVMRMNDYYGNTIRETPDIAAAVAARFGSAATVDNFVVLTREK